MNMTDDKIPESPDSTCKERLTLKKGEKLRHRSLVDAIFREGGNIYEYPLRLSWRKLTEDELEATFRDHVPAGIDSLQMLITVPKKKRRHAVDRVLMRRRIREAYRLNRNGLKAMIQSNPDIRTLGIALIYLHNDNLPYSTIESKMKTLFRKLSAKIEGRRKDLQEAKAADNTKGSDNEKQVKREEGE